MQEPNVPTSQVKALACPNCGGAVSLRGFGHTLNVVCVNCLSILDAKSPDLQLLQTFQERQRVFPLIPLGTRGKLHGDVYEVIGFQVREIMVNLVQYAWQEYLLFNSFKGFRYLTHYDGHWNDVKPIQGVPDPSRQGQKPAARWLGETYVHFQTADAETVFVMGEFPWQVRVGETVRTADYIAPPRVLSSETTDGEVTWSLGEYMTGEHVWRAFGMAGSPPAAHGVYANQPSPHEGKTGRAWLKAVWMLAALFSLMLLSSLWMGRQEAFRQKYSFSGSASEPSLVTPVFELKGRPSNVEILIHTDLNNEWAYFHLALIHESSGHALDFGREISYYHGRDSDGNWTEGRRGERVLVPTVAAGRYYLRVEPEMNVARAMSYELRVRRDVPVNLFFWIAAVLVVLPPVFVTLRGRQFESARWMESDYASSGSGDDEEEA